MVMIMRRNSLYNTYLGEFCATHKDWEYLLTHEPYNLKINRDGIYVIFKYNQYNSDFSIPLVQEARGIIFREGRWACPVCHAFDKFFNYGEDYAATIDWDSAKVTEKVDGSLIKIWRDVDFRWHISTNGCIDAFNAPLNGIGNTLTFGQLVKDIVPDNFFEILDTLDKQCFIFELVSPQNRIVIPYSKNKLYFLAERTFDDELVSFVDSTSVNMLKELCNIDTPKVYSLNSLETVEAAAKALPWDEEGYVVHDKYNRRIKVKSPEYVKAHYTRGNNQLSDVDLIHVILNNEVSEFLVYGDDYKVRLNNLKQFLYKFCRELLLSREYLNPDIYDSRADYAKSVKTFKSYTQNYLFKCYDTPSLSVLNILSF